MKKFLITLALMLQAWSVSAQPPSPQFAVLSSDESVKTVVARWARAQDTSVEWLAASTGSIADPVLTTAKLGAALSVYQAIEILLRDSEPHSLALRSKGAGKGYEIIEQSLAQGIN